MLVMYTVRPLRETEPVSHVARRRIVPAGGKVRTFHIPTELGAAQIRGIEQLDQCRAHLAEVMRRNIGGHPDRDTRRSIDQQIRQARGEDDRLGLRPVVIRPEGDGRLINLLEHFVRDAREPALGVAHRRRAVAVERTEVSRTVNQRVPQ
jgi:hypothetical protein